MKLPIIVTSVCSLCHLVLGLISICVGIVSCTQANIWLAHVVSPIWSGIFFVLTGAFGLACAFKCTSYAIMCFAAFSVVSLVTAVVSIQLLRIGLLSETPDGRTSQQEHTNIWVVIALVTTGIESLLCVFSAFISCKLASDAKKELQRKSEGTFHVKVMGEKDIVLVSKNKNNSSAKNGKIFSMSM